ncbi:MAG: pyridoxamine 5'-phosphate oxidase [Lysobacteraceae bacterium]|nr:MAG: pyridoxamine 5'-phosphate oxidase [Xanthomonadaceae bacterium]
MLTTRAPDGSLVSRPLQTLAFSDGELVFFTAADSGKLAELEADPDVNLAYADPARHRYVSVRGRARVTRSRATIEALWSVAQRVFFPGGKDDPNLVVLRVHVRDAAYWEPSGNFVVRALEFARGLLDDEPNDLGRQGIVHGDAGSASRDRGR